MRRLFRCKRGVSPLIATILLIAFAVALGAVVMQFGSGLESSGCGADLQITAQRGCVSGSGSAGQVKIDVKNIGAVNVGKIQLLVYGDKEGIKTKTNDSPLKTTASGSYSTEYDFATFGKVKRIEAIPSLEDGTECSDNKVIVKSVSPC